MFPLAELTLWPYDTASMGGCTEELGGWRGAQFSQVTRLLVAGFVGVGLAAVIGWYVSNLESDRIEADFRADTNELVLALEREMAANIEVLYAVKAFYDSSDEVRRDEFQQFSSQALSRHAAMRAVEWAPIVSSSMRDTHESEVQTRVSLTYRIAERGESGILVRAAERSSHVPVLFVEPWVGNEAALGFDLMSDTPRRVALEQARDTGLVVASKPITLVQSTTEVMGFLVFLPVYKGPTETVAERRERCQGFVVGVFEVRRILEGALGSLGNWTDDAAIEVVASTTDGRRNVLYRHGWQGQTQVDEMAYQLSFAYIDGLAWTLKFRPNRSYIVHRDSHRPLILFLIVLVFATTVTALLLALMQRQRQVIEARNAAQAATEAKSLFLANMSHEIRTPMNAVIGMTDLMLQETMPSHQRQYVETVQESGKMLLSIINDILDFSKIEAGEVDIRRDVFDVRDSVFDVLRTLAVTASRKHLQLIGHVDNDVPDTVRGDDRWVRQVLINLIGNAIKFTSSGEVVVSVTAVEPLATAPMSLRFEIADTGIGMSESDCANVFQAFKQVGRARVLEHGGTGLGLAISQKMVGLMEGDIGVESELGEGSVFWFTIPLVLPEYRPVNGSEHQETRKKTGEILVLVGVRVLLLDDGDTSRRVLAGYMMSWGLSVTSATSAERRTILAEMNAGIPYRIVVLRILDSDGARAGIVREVRGSAAIDAAATVITIEQVMSRDGDDTDIDASLIEPVHPFMLRRLLCAAMEQPSRKSESDVTSDSWAPKDADLDVVGGRILLAEDNPINRRVAVAMLQRLGYTVDVVVDGRQAVDAALKTSYDCVLMDCKMPVMDGYLAVSELRARELETQRTTVVAMTAHATDSERERAFNVGMDDYLSKPVTMETLQATLRRWVSSTPMRPGTGGE